MAFHKRGLYSFRVKVQRMMIIGGHNFVADITALLHHGPSGAAQVLEIPVIAEQYGETAQEAEGLAIEAMHNWLDAAGSRHAAPDTNPAVSQAR